MTPSDRNPGHVLWLGLLDEARGQRVADRLMQPDLFSGWGLRTLSSSHPAYDPFRSESRPRALAGPARRSARTAGRGPTDAARSVQRLGSTDPVEQPPRV